MGKYTKTGLSIANKIYRERIRADYPPPLPLTLSISLLLSLTPVTGQGRGRLSALANRHTVKQ